MKDYLKEYQEYYRTRMLRYENDPELKESYESEKKIYEAIAGCTELTQFKERLGNLNELNAVAATRDRQRVYISHYESMQETVRAKTPRRIMEKALNFDKVLDLIEMINEEEARGMLEIAADTVTPFDSWIHLENYEIYSSAEIPSSYAAVFKKRAEECIVDMKNAIADAEENMQKYVPGWKFNPALVKEFRHRRKFPVSDKAFDERLQTFSKIVNR